MPGVPIVDKSDYVASITSLNGCLNGTMTPHINFGIDTITKRPETWWSEGKERANFFGKAFLLLCKILCILDNLNHKNQTSKSRSDRILQKISMSFNSNKETIYRLGMQRNILLQSGYAETFGLERKPGESIPAMVYRILND